MPPSAQSDRGRAAMLLIVTDDTKLLLHHRDDKPGIPHPGCWSGFGGAVEDGESAGQAVRRKVLEETGLRIGQPVFLTEEVDAEGDGRLVSLFYVAGGISPADIDLREGAGVGVHGIGDLEHLRVAPFVYRAVRSHLLPALGPEPAEPKLAATEIFSELVTIDISVLNSVL